MIFSKLGSRSEHWTDEFVEDAYMEVWFRISVSLGFCTMILDGRTEPITI